MTLPLPSRIRPEVFYAVVALLFGAVLALMPPLYGADENSHVLRVWLLSEGKVYPQTDGKTVSAAVPASLEILFKDLIEFREVHPMVRVRPFASLSAYLDHLKGLLALGSPGERRVSLPIFSAHAATSPLIYLPQAAGMALARLWTDSVVLAWFAGRLVNLLVGVALTAFAIRLMPFKQWSLCYVGLLPMTVNQYAGLSGDAVTTAMSFLFIALATRTILAGPRTLTRARVAGAAVATACLASLKLTYGIIAGLYAPLMLRRDSWHAPLPTFLFLAMVAAVAVGVTAGWAWMGRSLALDAGYHPGLDMQAQTRFILESPLSFLQVVLETLAVYGWHWGIHLYGVLGWLSVLLPLNHYYLGGAVFLLLLALDNPARGELPSRGMAALRLVALAVLGAELMLLFVSFFVYWTPVGAERIEGIQGRYLTPLVPLLLVALVSRGGLFPGQRDVVALVVQAMSIYGLVVALQATHAVYLAG